jgi:hypothetical protein
MKQFIEKLRRFCAFVTGFVFFISGILKVLDPVGAGLVMKEYLEFLHIGFMGFAAKGLGTAFALAETIIGASLITGVWRKTTAWAAMILQGFFTLLTLALVIFNPEMDCGCFGEAIHLTHGETFIKNLVLCGLMAAAFIPMKDMGQPLKKKYVSFSIVTVSVLAFCLYSLMYIPLIDFTEYRQTALLQTADSFPTSEEDRYEAVFIYEKDGEKKTFDLQHLPDSTWTFVSTETVLKEEYQDNGINLSFRNAEGEYSDQLAAEGNVMVISLYDPEIKAARWKETAEFIRNASKAGYTPLLLTASTPGEMAGFLQNADEASRNIIENSLYFSDYKTLLTLNRSNGGAVWFSDGYLIRKWARRALPDEAQMKAGLDSDVTEAIIEKSTRGSLAFQGFLLYVFAVMLLL